MFICNSTIQQTSKKIDLEENAKYKTNPDLYQKIVNLVVYLPSPYSNSSTNSTYHIAYESGVARPRHSAAHARSTHAISACVSSHGRKHSRNRGDLASR